MTCQLSHLQGRLKHVCSALHSALCRDVRQSTWPISVTTQRAVHFSLRALILTPFRAFVCMFIYDEIMSALDSEWSYPKKILRWIQLNKRQSQVMHCTNTTFLTEQAIKRSAARLSFKRTRAPGQMALQAPVRDCVWELKVMGEREREKVTGKKRSWQCDC